MHRIRRLATVTLVTGVLGLGLSAAPAFAGAEGSFVAKINAERTARGLGALEVYWDLTDDARAHTNRMMADDSLYHNPNLGSVTTGWQALGENVGVGTDVDRLHTAFMTSPNHRANILGDFNYVGVGVAVEADTKMWVTVVFMRGPDGLVSPPAEEEPEPEPAPPPEVPEPAPAPAPTPVPAPTPAPAPAQTAVTASVAAPLAASGPVTPRVPIVRWGHASLGRHYVI